jgi:hypothetical protein
VLIDGIDVGHRDAADLAARLVAAGSPDALSTSEMVEKAVHLHFARVVLTPAQRDAVRFVLREDAPDGLFELRSLLAWVVHER